MAAPTKELSLDYAESTNENLTPVYLIGFCLVSARGTEGSEKTYRDINSGKRMKEEKPGRTRECEGIWGDENPKTAELAKCGHCCVVP
jgi:hypothetical protein